MNTCPGGKELCPRHYHECDWIKAHIGDSPDKVWGLRCDEPQHQNLRIVDDMPSHHIKDGKVCNCEQEPNHD